MTATAIAETRSSPMSRLLPVVLPAIVVGVASSLALRLVTLIASELEQVLWDAIPGRSASIRRPRSGSS